MEPTFGGSCHRAQIHCPLEWIHDPREHMNGLSEQVNLSHGLIRRPLEWIHDPWEQIRCPLQ